MKKERVTVGSDVECEEEHDSPHIKVQSNSIKWLKRIATAGAITLALYAGARSFNPSRDYSSTVYSELDRRSRRFAAEQLRKALLYVSEDNLLSTLPNDDILNEAARIIKKQGAGQQAIDEVYSASRQYADPRKVNADAAALTYSLIQGGRVTREGLGYFRSAVDSRLPPERIAVGGNPDAGSDNPYLAGLESLSLDETMPVFTQKYLSLQEGGKSLLVRHCVSLMNEGPERDRTILSLLSYLSDKGSMDAARGVTDSFMRQYSQKINERCGINPLCTSAVEQALSYRPQLERILAREIKGLGNPDQQNRGTR